MEGIIYRSTLSGVPVEQVVYCDSEKQILGDIRDVHVKKTGAKLSSVADRSI
jgi:hypothetical protein